MLSNIFDSHKSLRETAAAAEASLGVYLSSYPTRDGFNANEASKIRNNDHFITHDNRNIRKENKNKNHQDQ